MKRHGHVVWLFGLSGSGKSTLAVALQAELLQESTAGVLMLDGDRLRAGLCRGLGFSEIGREENLRRAAEVARLGVESGLLVVAAFITPLERHREMIRGIVGDARLSLIHLAATLDVCRRRDVKGLYSASNMGSLTQLSGIDSVFENPSHVDFRLDTGIRDVRDCVVALSDFVRQRSRLDG